MKLKNFTLKSLTALTLMLLAFAANAQSDQDVPLGTTTVFNYTVDTSSDPTQPLLNDQPNGTPGSTYAWSIVNLPAPGAILTPTGNKATINWAAVPVGIYHVQVIETNTGCPPETVEFEVHVIQPNNPTLVWADAPNAICEGDIATFDVSGAPVGAVISYTATGGTPATGTATVLAGGIVSIPITHVAPATQVVLTLTSMNVGGNTVTFTPPITATAQVNIVQTSAIQLVP